MKSSSPQSYYILAIVDTNTDALLAAGSVFLEHKFIRNLGICGHIEDIAVDPSTQGKGLGKIIINALTELSESLGSYKVILDCSEDVRSGSLFSVHRRYLLTFAPPASRRILREVRVRVR